jgi:hypothetical protein
MFAPKIDTLNQSLCTQGTMTAVAMRRMLRSGVDVE